MPLGTDKAAVNVIAQSIQMGNAETKMVLNEYHKNVNKSMELYSYAMNPYETKLTRSGEEEVVYGDDFAGVCLTGRCEV